MSLKPKPYQGVRRHYPRYGHILGLHSVLQGVRVVVVAESSPYPSAGAVYPYPRRGKVRTGPLRPVLPLYTVGLVLIS